MEAPSKTQARMKFVGIRRQTHTLWESFKFLDTTEVEALPNVPEGESIIYYQMGLQKRDVDHLEIVRNP